MAGSSTRVCVALIEDHRATREALSDLLRGSAPAVQLQGAYADAESFLAACPPSGLEVVLVDLNLPGMSGTELIARLSADFPDIRSVALTVFADEVSVSGALRAGAFGYLLKDESSQRLLQALDEATAGEHPISSRVAGFLVTRYRQAPVSTPLSDRELQLAKALASGHTYGECAELMGIAHGTVQDYVKRLYRKLKVHNKKDLRGWVERLGGEA